MAFTNLDVEIVIVSHSLLCQLNISGNYIDIDMYKLDEKYLRENKN